MRAYLRVVYKITAVYDHPVRVSDWCWCRLDDEMQVKVADFGLSRDIYERDYYSSDNRKTKLPVKWMALESLEKGIYNSKTDVVSFTVITR